jgi:hypothetical protein
MVSFTRVVRGYGNGFEIDVELETGLITGHAGVPGLIEAFRQTGTAAVIDREIKLKSRKRGLSGSEMVESLLAMWAAGGERAEDLDQFRQDKALALQEPPEKAWKNCGPETDARCQLTSSQKFFARSPIGLSWSYAKSARSKRDTLFWSKIESAVVVRTCWSWPGDRAEL